MLRPSLASALALALAAVVAVPAAAKPPGVNGRIAYVHYTGEGFFGTDLFTANPDGSYQQLLWRDAEGLHWSPDGERAALALLTPDGRITSATLDADGTQLQPLQLPDATVNFGPGAWTPDGSRLLLEGWDDTDQARTGMWTSRSADFGDLRQLTMSPFGGHDAPADYSPDGTRILFTRDLPGKAQGQRALFVSRADGTGAQQITPWGLENSYKAGWSPDGQRIVFDSKGSIYLVRPDGTHMTTVTIDVTGDRRYAFNAGWSPDGTRLGFTLCLRKANDCDVYTMRPDGSHVEQVTHTPGFDEFSDWGTHPLAH